jgi:hypothetical protein
MRWVAAQRTAAETWRDSAFRRVQGRVLTPLDDETKRMYSALERLDTELGRARATLNG